MRWTDNYIYAINTGNIAQIADALRKYDGSEFEYLLSEKLPEPVINYIKTTVNNNNLTNKLLELADIEDYIIYTDFMRRQIIELTKKNIKLMNEVVIKDKPTSRSLIKYCFNLEDLYRLSIVLPDEKIKENLQIIHSCTMILYIIQREIAKAFDEITIINFVKDWIIDKYKKSKDFVLRLINKNGGING